MTRTEFRGSIALGVLIVILTGCIAIRRCTGPKLISGSGNQTPAIATGNFEAPDTNLYNTTDTIESASCRLHAGNADSGKSRKGKSGKSRKKASRRKGYTPPPDLASPHDRPVPTSR